MPLNKETKPKTLTQPVAKSRRQEIKVELITLYSCLKTTL